jgi:hypothetical protein
VFCAVKDVRTTNEETSNDVKSVFILVNLIHGTYSKNVP